MSSKIKGVFLLEKQASIGTGHTAKKVNQKIYCLARELDDGEIEVRYLGANDKPLNITEKIPKEKFIHSFTFQPYYLEQKKAQRACDDKKQLNKHLAIAEEHVSRNELYSAEYEYNNALRIDEEDLRANFGIGNVYLKMGETEKAREIYIKVSRIDAIFEKKNKHFFNEGGIQLRKLQLYDEAIQYYNTAISVSPDDEHLYFNLARAHFEKGQTEKAYASIHTALSINPALREAKAFINYMNKKKVTAPLP